ncbi:MAG: hypothetical protein AAFZ52_01225 [Bacteroidota bacterium]
MLRKILRWLFIALGLVVLLLTGAAWALHGYLNQSKEQILADLAHTTGLDLTFRDLNVTFWETFPQVSVRVDSLVIRDTLRAGNEPPLLQTNRLRGRLSLGALLRDTLRFQDFSLRGGGLYLSRDSSDRFNFGRLGQPAPARDSSALTDLLPEADWQGLHCSLTDFRLTFRDAKRRKYIDVHLDSLRTSARRDEAGTLRFPLTISAQVGGIAFNTDKGSYLKNAPLVGKIDLSLSDTALAFPLTELTVAGNVYSLQANLPRRPGRSGRVHLGCNATDYAAARALLHDTLTAQLANYYVDRPFPVQALIETDPAGGPDPEVTAAFRLSGHRVRIKQFVFTDVHTAGRFRNRLSPARGGIPGSRKNLRIDLDSTRGYQGQLYVQAARAQVRGADNKTHLVAPLRLSGPASAISKRIGAVDFVFTQGRFQLDTRVDASLDDVEELISSSDGTLRLWDTDVYYRPGEVRFPFRSIALRKAGEDISFRVSSKPLRTGFTFDLAGKIDNLTPLLLDRPGQPLQTDVSFHAPRLGWTDFLAIFGEDGYLVDGKAPVTDRQGMKATLLGLRRTFRPTIDARFDTVAYYDVFAVHNFATGMHFAADTLVLERTTFDWGESELAFGARLGLAQARETPFSLNARAEHLNLNHLRPTLAYFGLQLPAGLDSLPHDLNVDFSHRGVLDDVFGLQPGRNAGRLNFDDGAEALFGGDLHYAPGPTGLSTRLHLEGDPHVVNVLFSSRDFLFGTGRFRLDLATEGTPANLRELLTEAKLQLRLDSTRVRYQPGGFYVPIRRFDVTVADERVDYSLRLLNDRSRRSVEMHGSLDRLAAFLHPEPHQPFRITTDFSAQRLHWKDLQSFVQMDTTDNSPADTIPFNPQRVLSATSGIFASFRPELSLTIDTFETGSFLPFTNVYSSVRLRDSTALLLEKTGFSLGEGRVEFDASYALDTLQVSPFTVHWRMDSLVLEELLPALRELQMPDLEQAGLARGRLSTTGSLVGVLDEKNQQISFDDAAGDITFQLTGAELADWPFLVDIGRKAKMKKRFRHLRFADLEGRLFLKDGKLLLPRTEVQSTALQLFVEGKIDPTSGPDLLVSVPLRNIGQGLRTVPPDTTGYALAGWKVRFVLEPEKTRFRLGSRRYYRERGQLEEFLRNKKQEREVRRRFKRTRRSLRRHAPQ